MRGHPATRKQEPAAAQTHLCSSPPGGVAAGRPADTAPTRAHSLYRLSWSPAVAEIAGDRRPWTALMISLLSMPCR